MIYFGTDHAGFELKEQLLPFVKELGYDVEDCGAYEYEEGDDYPDFTVPVAEKVSATARTVEEDRTRTDADTEERSFGIILGGSGQGEAICANKFPGVRAAVFYGGDQEIVRLSREHNDANVLSLGARFLDTEEAKEAVKVWLETGFSGDERHLRRLEKIEGIST